MDGDILQIPVPFDLPPGDGPIVRSVILVHIRSNVPQAYHQQTGGDNSPDGVAPDHNMAETGYPSPPSTNDRVSTRIHHPTIDETGRREAQIIFEGQELPRTYEITNDPRSLPSIRTLVAHAFEDDSADLATDDQMLESVAGALPYPVPANTARRYAIRHIFNARAWSWASLMAIFTLFSSIPSLALLIASHVAQWSSSAQKGLLFWFILSVVIFFTSVIVLVGLSGKLEKAAERVRKFYGGAGIARSQGQGEEEEGYALQNLETRAPPNTPVSVYFRFPSRSSEERSIDRGGAESSLQTGRDGIRHISMTGRERLKPDSDSDTSLHPGFAKADCLNRIQRPNWPISRASVSQPQTIPLEETKVRRADHRRARHPILSNSHDTPFAGLIAEESLRKESAERHRQDRRQQQRVETQRTLPGRFNRPDTPRPVGVAPEPTLTPTQLIVHRSRGLPLRISNAALVGTPPGTLSDDFGRSTPTTARAISQHQAQLPTPPENNHRLPTTGKYKPLPPPPRRTSIVDNPSPPSSDAGSVIHYTRAQMKAEAHARAVKAETEAEAMAEKQRRLQAEKKWLEERHSWQEEKKKSRRASGSILRTGTPSTLVEFDRHLRNSGALELNAYLDRHEDIRTASELSFTRPSRPAKEYAVETYPRRKLANETTHAYFDRQRGDIPTAYEQGFTQFTEPPRNRAVVASPKRKLFVDTSSSASSPFREDQRQIKRRREELQGKFRRSQGYMQLPSLSPSAASSDHYSHRYSTGTHVEDFSPRYRVKTHDRNADTPSYDAHPPPTPVTAIRDPPTVSSTLPINFISPLIPVINGCEDKGTSPLKVKDANKKMVANDTKNSKSEENSVKERRKMFFGREVGARDKGESHMVRAGKPDGKENIPPSGSGYPDASR